MEKPLIDHDKSLLMNTISKTAMVKGMVNETAYLELNHEKINFCLQGSEHSMCNRFSSRIVSHYKVAPAASKVQAKPSQVFNASK